MRPPPFQLSAAAISLAMPGHAALPCCDHTSTEAATPVASPRTRLVDLDPHMHCSVIGTCLGTAELRKLMGRFEDVQGASDLTVHHLAVGLASQSGDASKALQRLLDHRHEAEIRRFSRVRDVEGLQGLWAAALRTGEVPGAYWALLTHRAATSDLRNQAFGDVHMLSHLAGASHRADLRRDAALEHENSDLRERVALQQERLQRQDEERHQLQAAMADQADELATLRAQAAASEHSAAELSDLRDQLADARALLAVHTGRRERAEQSSAAAESENARLTEELQRKGLQLQTLASELATAEQLLREPAPAPEGPPRQRRLEGRRVLYVGGRPSSAVAIRELVARHGGELQRHDGGLEDRKGLLAAAAAWADVMVFPVDCIDHDSAGLLKRLCQRAGKPLLPLRSASVTSFAAALLGTDAATPAPGCWRHA